MFVLIRNILKKAFFNLKILRTPAVKYCCANSLLPELFVSMQSKNLRDTLFLPESAFDSQLNQDIFALLVNKYKSGYFLEIGANDGFTLSNTIYLEEMFEWKGLLVEANPLYAESLSKRKADFVISAIAEKNESYRFSSAGLYGGITDLLGDTHKKMTDRAELIDVTGRRLAPILDESKAPARIDYVSIDVEGAEVSIVEQMTALTDYRFTCGSIEHNSRTSDYKKLKKLLRKARYRIVWADKTKHDLFFVDQDVNF